MGTLINGVWHTEETLTRSDPDGSWQRARSIVRHWVTPDGAPGPTGEGGFAAAPGRYHLYAAWNCPWAHRALLTRLFKQLHDLLPVSFVVPRRTDQGWVFDAGQDAIDHLFGAGALHEIYSRGTDNYTGRVTLPVLYDTHSDRLVSNESADVIRMLNSAFAAHAPQTADLCPPELLPVIDRWNARIYKTLNNGVYRAGFAESQGAYEAAAWEVFETLDAIEAHLRSNLWLAGDQMTEADVRLFPTLVRFDVAYHGAFKCNLRRISDYPALWRYARRLYGFDGVADTVRFDIYKRGYYSPSEKRNPFGIVPGGPDIDWGSEPVSYRR